MKKSFLNITISPCRNIFNFQKTYRISLCLFLESNASLLDEEITTDVSQNASPFSFLSGMLEKERSITIYCVFSSQFSWGGFCLLKLKEK